MVVRLQTAEGRIKKYQTTRVLFESYVEGFPIDKYVTKCGREWKPGTENQECDHLELDPVCRAELALLGLCLDLAHLAGENRDEGCLIVASRRL